MNAPEKIFLPDVQSSMDERCLAIQNVGVKGLRYPLQIETGSGEMLATVATLAMSVGLPPDIKGTHMSRFVEILEGRRGMLTQDGLFRMLDEMLLRLEARSGRIELAFPYFIRKAAPVSGVESLLDYDVAYIVEAREGEYASLTLRVTAPVTSLCPCSKKISDYGAHNQRSHVTVTAQTNGFLWIEDLIRKVEDQASCELWSLLKRPDEKYVTERAYDNPKFVEDIVRDVAAAMNAEPLIDQCVVEAENFESIHNHSAYALIERDKRTQA